MDLSALSSDSICPCSITASITPIYDKTYSDAEEIPAKSVLAPLDLHLDEAASVFLMTWGGGEKIEDIGLGS